MAIDSFNFQFKDGRYIPSCSGCGQSQVGDTIYLLPNPPAGVTDWPEYVKADITNIVRTTDGPIYTFTYENTDWIPGEQIRDCDISGSRCPTCCDELTTEQVLPTLDLDGDGVIDDQFIPEVQASEIVGLCPEVVSCLDTNADGVIDTLDIDASGVQNFCPAVVACLDTDGDGVIDALDVNAADIEGLCPAVVACLDTDGDGVIDDQFLPTVTADSVDGLCPAVVACLDTDGDGVLDALDVDATSIQNFETFMDGVLLNRTFDCSALV